jgi:hypothetical protein
MPRASLLRTTLLTSPLTLADALRLLDDADIPDTTKPAVRSTAIDAVRHALRDGVVVPSKEQALAADIRDLLPILHVTAREAARAKNHRQPNEHAARAHRFVEILTGRRYDTPRLDHPCPEAWAPLLAGARSRNANGELAFLARCCMLAGEQDAPRRLPSRAQFTAAAQELVTSKASSRLKNALSLYRTLRQRMLDAAPEPQRAALAAQFAPMARGVSARTSHLGVEAETIAYLTERCLAPADMTAKQMFRAIAPGLAADYDYWAVDGAGRLESDSYVEQCGATLLRVVGWAVRAGKIAEVARMQNLLDLFLLTERVPGAATLNKRLAAMTGAAPGAEALDSVSLLEFLVEREAAASLARSTIADADGRDEKGRPWITLALWQGCSRVWDVAQDIYRDIGSQGPEFASKWALVESRWGRLQSQLSARQIPAEARLRTKDKLRMIRTVTLPQLVCLGFPLRRREVYERRRVWLDAVAAARAAGHAPESHPEVRAAAALYFDGAAVPFLATTLATDDGLRRKQYTRGRLGDGRNFRITLSRDENGRPVGVASLTTTWTGDRRDPAHLKIREKDNKQVRRVDRVVRPGIVDHTILWDVLTWWRPMQLVACGVLPSLADYDLEADLTTGEYALFPSRSADVGLHRPERSRTDVGDLVGRELHLIVRTYLRPELPAWEELGAEWRALWAIHILRLLTSTYWGGVREKWGIATDLTLDTEPTLRRSYLEVDKRMTELRGRDTSHWEHPNAYDPWMDRLFFDIAVLDPLLDPALPTPEHLRDRVGAPIASTPGSATASGSNGASRVRIRAARPEQQRPLPAGRSR